MMTEFGASGSGAVLGLAASLILALLAWIASLWLRKASIVDSFWPGFVVCPAVACAAAAGPPGTRGYWVLLLAGIWALRLSGYVTWRNRGQAEDRRYQQIRARNEPGFAWKSLYLVFILQAVLAWIISLPLQVAARGGPPMGWLDVAGLALAAVGIACEGLADWQMARFRARPQRSGVMDGGLWRYSRHPNYFGEFLVWWGLSLPALAAGAWWVIVSPLLMTLLLLRVSGVTLLETDLVARKPQYRDYVARTNAFFPGPRRRADPRS